MSHSTPLRVVIGAGGTGGHIYPGLATADAIRRLSPGARVTFSGTDRGLETTLVPAAGYDLDLVPMKPFARCSDAHLAAFPIHLGRSVARAAAQLRRERVDVVIGMGGYPSVPVVLAARILGIPALLHESNAVPGRANVLAARFVRNIATGFDPRDARWCRGRDVRHLGIPVVSALESVVAGALRPRARKAFDVNADQRLIVVSGGSLGASRLNRAAVDLAVRWRSRDDVRFVVKARPDDRAELEAVLARSGAGRVARIVDHIDSMDLAYAAADAMVLRAGSATIAELELMGTPAVLVPYPQAPGDHQTHNARALAETGQAVVVADHDLDASALAASLDALPALRPVVTGAGGARPLHATAAESLARWALDLAGQPGASAPFTALQKAVAP